MRPFLVFRHQGKPHKGTSADNGIGKRDTKPTNVVMNTNIITILSRVENKANRVFMDASKHTQITKHLKYIVCLLVLLGCFTMQAQSISEIRAAAENGDAKGQVQLGLVYKNGRGVMKDYAEAIKWFRKAADQGNAQAQVQLGQMYFDGEGVAKNYAEAAKWLQKTADTFPDARYMLGVLYDNGWGVTKDHIAAAKLFIRAAHGASKEARSYLERMFSENLWDKGVQYECGRIYYSMHKDEDEYEELSDDNAYNNAIKWFRKAADQGHSGAQVALGDMYYKGEGVAKDYAEAVKWFRKAAEQGNSYAQFSLGWMYAKGGGVAKDEAEAVKWYRMAAKQGEANAQGELKKMGLTW